MQTQSHRHTHTPERRPGTTVAEVGAMQLQAKGCWEPLRVISQGRILPQSLQRQRGPTDTWISAFWPPQLWEDMFVLFWATQFVVRCYSSPRKQIQSGECVYTFKRVFILISPKVTWVSFQVMVAVESIAHNFTSRDRLPASSLIRSDLKSCDFLSCYSTCQLHSTLFHVALSLFPPHPGVRLTDKETDTASKPKR